MNKIKLTRIENMKTLRKEGLTFKEIAIILGCAASTVSHHISEATRDKNRARSRKNYVYKAKGLPVVKTPEEIQSAAKSRMLKHRYGITQEEYEFLYQLQNGKCAICEEPRILGSRNGLYVDHCHKTGEVRGLLCPACNSALGKFKESPELLKKAIEYCSR